MHTQKYYNPNINQTIASSGTLLHRGKSQPYSYPFIYFYFFIFFICFVFIFYFCISRKTTTFFYLYFDLPGLIHYSLFNLSKNVFKTFFFIISCFVFVLISYFFCLSRNWEPNYQTYPSVGVVICDYKRVSSFGSSSLPYFFIFFSHDLR